MSANGIDEIVETASGVGDENDGIRFAGLCPGRFDHSAIQATLRGEDAGRIDENDSSLADKRYPSKTRPRRLRLCVTIDTLAPTRAFTSVDFPAFGAPIMAAKPQRVSGTCTASSGIFPLRRKDPFADQKRLRSRLLRLFQRRPLAPRRLQSTDGHFHRKAWRMISAASGNLLVVGETALLALRKFLQGCFGIRSRRRTAVAISGAHKRCTAASEAAKPPST